MIEHTITANTEIEIKWTVTKEYQWNGYAGDLPLALRDKVLGRPLAEDALFDAVSDNKDHLNTVDMLGLADLSDDRIESIDEVFIYG